jgi:GntR family transcriptional regulator/MocR family aminotransferase
MVLVTPHRQSRRPLVEQIADGLRVAIERGRLAPGAALPSTRALATDLGVARATVTHAYDRLRALGLIDARPASATRVSATIAAGPVPASSRAAPVSRPVTPSALARSLTDVVSSYPVFRTSDDAPRPFRSGQPAVDLFPTGVWGRLMAARWRRVPAAALGYGDSLGLDDLRRAVAGYVARARGLDCRPDQIVITQGAQHAMALVCRALLTPGDRAWVEDPGYPGARFALGDAGARPAAVPVDEDGLRVDDAIRLAPDARLAIVTPSRQMPLGTAMSASRRTALLNWAAAPGRWVIEDDYDSEFRYVDRPSQPLYALDDAGAVIHIGSFTKLLYPALRLGYIVLPKAPDAAATLRETIGALRRASDVASPYFEQAVMADFIDGGELERHLRTVRGVYRRRLEVLRHAIESDLAGLASMQPSDAGRAVLLWLAPEIAEGAAVREATAAGVDVVPLSAFCVSPMARGGLVLGYGGLRDSDIRRGVAALAGALRKARRGRTA